MLITRKIALKVTLSTVLILSFLNAFSQKIENFKTEIVEGEVIIHYDLLGADTSQIFEIRVYSIIENYKQRIYRGVGDVGRNIKPGRNKRIVWNNKEELTSYRIKDMDFELETALIFSPLIFKNPISNARYKRGNPIKIEWIGGENFEKLKIELYQNNVKIRSIGTVTNRGSHVWKIPSKLAPGSGYNIRLTREGKEDSGVFSPKFTVNRKVSTYAKIIPAAAIGLAGITYLIVSSIGGGGTDTPDDILPSPINPDPR